VTSLIVRKYDDAVIVTGLAEIEVLSQEKKRVSFKMRYINVWARDPSGWRIVVSESAAVRESLRATPN
jgi:ketosteroid isomerase-like protein